uniref:hypothetical protein n=1 Tax=uncultured Paraglaciecola sp. TaxID=1765024 RepID=UPI0025FBF345
VLIPPIRSVYFEVRGTPPEQIEVGIRASHHSPLFTIIQNEHLTLIKNGVKAVTLAAKIWQSNSNTKKGYPLY